MIQLPLTSPGLPIISCPMKWFLVKRRINISTKLSRDVLTCAVLAEICSVSRFDNVSKLFPTVEEVEHLLMNIVRANINVSMIWSV